MDQSMRLVANCCVAQLQGPLRAAGFLPELSLSIHINIELAQGGDCGVDVGARLMPNLRNDVPALADRSACFWVHRKDGRQYAGVLCAIRSKSMTVISYLVSS